MEDSDDKRLEASLSVEMSGTTRVARAHEAVGLQAFMFKAIPHLYFCSLFQHSLYFMKSCVTHNVKSTRQRHCRNYPV